MKTYEITVDGQVYQVTLKEIDASQAANQAAPAPSQAPAAQPVSAAPSSGASNVEILAPMAGNILSIAVKVGDQVKKGDLLLVLEAMKMENEILAPQNGQVAQILISEKNSVESGQVLLTL